MYTRVNYINRLDRIHAMYLSLRNDHPIKFHRSYKIDIYTEKIIEVGMSRDQRTFGEKIGDLLLEPRMKILEAIMTSVLFTIAGILYEFTRNLFMTGVYIAFVLLILFSLRYLAHRAEQRRLELTERTARYRRVTYERAAEAISPSQSSLFNRLNDSILPIPSNEEKKFMEAFIERLLEDLTTRVFEADVRASDVGTGRWAGQSFKATLMVKQLFTEQEFERLSNLIQDDKEMTDTEKQSEKRKYQKFVNRKCMFIKYWYYPGNAHPESLGTPYMINDGVAGRAWFWKSLLIWTPGTSCTPRLIIPSNIFSEKYRGQQSKFSSMVCVPVESINKEKRFLPPSDTEDDGVLGILTITCERKTYLIPEVDFAKYLQTLLSPYIVILSYALERAYGV